MRIKFSVARHARKKKVLKRASGYYGDKSRRLRMATQQLDKSYVPRLCVKKVFPIPNSFAA